jgi:hypothetical protein
MATEHAAVLAGPTGLFLLRMGPVSWPKGSRSDNSSTTVMRTAINLSSAVDFVGCTGSSSDVLSVVV